MLQHLKQEWLYRGSNLDTKEKEKNFLAQTV